MIPRPPRETRAPRRSDPTTGETSAEAWTFRPLGERGSELLDGTGAVLLVAAAPVATPVEAFHRGASRLAAALRACGDVPTENLAAGEVAHLRLEVERLQSELRRARNRP